MSDVVALRKYTAAEDVDHVMYSRQEIENIHKCETCGDLQVISGVVWHTKPIEEHQL